MSRFDTFVVVDWSAGKRAPVTPSKDAIWIGLVRNGIEEEPMYCRTRQEAEARIADLFAAEMASGRRVLAGFDFPFGYPKGFARRITGNDDPFSLWAWLAERIEDHPDGSNNRYHVAEAMNARFEGLGPFWGKPNQTDWPGIPYRKSGIVFEAVAEHRHCDRRAKAASSCFQLAFPPTVGGQVLMGLPVLHRLRQADGVVVWPFEDWSHAPVVLAEIWPGLIEASVRTAVAALGAGAIRDKEQVRLLARALSRLTAAECAAVLTDLPEAAGEEASILGAGHAQRLTELAATSPLDPPPLRNDCFALPAGVDWTPVDQALALLRAQLGCVVGPETVPLMDAAGRVLAEDVNARRANPPHPNTAVDGYGFAAAGVGIGAVRVPLVAGRAAAGKPFEGAVPDGHAVRVLTGADLPRGVDTVVLDEDVTLGTGEIAFRADLRTGANTRRAGEDVQAGARALAGGRVLTPADLALAAAVGHGSLPVLRRLRVAVISTGDELVEAGEQAGAGQIYDANRPMLLSMAARWGYEALDLGRVPDLREALRARLDRAAASADVILTSGGASAGDEDHVSALLREAGAMQEWRIALKPGRPLALGLWNGTPVFGLPGNPVAALVCTLVFARPAMGLLSGAGWSEPLGFEVPAAFEKRKKPGRREYLRARIREGRAEVFKSEGSGRISGLSWAEGLVEIGDGARDIRPGDSVRFLPFGSFGL